VAPQRGAGGSTSRYMHSRRSHRLPRRARSTRGFRVAKGRFIAIFDADFMPTTDFLQRTVDFFSDPQIAMVQARWGHINQDYSLLTKVQSILLDAHFVLEHGRPEPLGTLLSTSTARRASGGPRRRIADAGRLASTTR